MSNHTTWSSAVEMIRRAATARGRATTGLYAIEGTRLVERALRAGAAVETVLMGENFAAQTDARTQQLLADVAARGVTPVIAPETVMTELAEGRQLGAVMGLVRLPGPAVLPNLLASAGAPLLLAGVDILDPGNAGALVRTAHAAGAAAFLAVGTTDPFHPRATRISRGSIFRLPVIPMATAADMLATLQRLSVRTVATAAAGGVPLPSLGPMSGPTVVLMGNEGEGLPDAVQQAVDQVVTIPMPAGVDSFAVNAAAAIVLYAIAQVGRLPDSGGHPLT
jgi:TrmH family RNA methyltransferase